MSAMPSDNESIRSHLVGGNYTRHEHGVNLHSAVQYGRAKLNFVNFVSEAEQEMLSLYV